MTVREKTYRDHDRDVRRRNDVVDERTAPVFRVAAAAVAAAAATANGQYWPYRPDSKMTAGPDDLELLAKVSRELPVSTRSRRARKPFPTSIRQQTYLSILAPPPSPELYRPIVLNLGATRTPSHLGRSGHF